MIDAQEDMINIVLGEGDIGIGIAMEVGTMEPRGISFHQLEEKSEIGTFIDTEGDKSVKPIGIIFSNKKSFYSLIDSLKSFVKAHDEWNREEEK